MKKKYVTITNSYRGLDKVVSVILENMDDDHEFDIAIIPPNLSLAIDQKESAAENKERYLLTRVHSKI